MKTLVLKEEVIDRIKSDRTLFADVAEALKISVYTLPAYLRRNDLKLTQKSALVAISRHMDRDENSLLEVANVETAA